MRRAHGPRHKHGLLPPLDRLHAPPCDRIALEPGLIWVGLADRAAIDGGGAEVALDRVREEVREGDGGVLNCERLVEVQGRGFRGGVDGARRRGNGGGEGVDEKD
jgi:hypothetical protein